MQFLNKLFFFAIAAHSQQAFADQELTYSLDDRAGMTNNPVQTIGPGEIAVTSDGLLQIPVYYGTSDGSGTFSGLGLRIHYNSAEYTSINLGNAITDGLIGVQDVEDTDDFDGDAATDRFIMVAWGSLNGSIDLDLSSPLLFVEAMLLQEPSTPIRFTAVDTQPNYGFSSKLIDFDSQKIGTSTSQISERVPPLGGCEKPSGYGRGGLRKTICAYER